MTFKEFARWCNDRASDGHWGMQEAIFCSGVCREIYSVKPLLNREKKREHAWQNLPKRKLAEEIVAKTNRIIQQMGYEL